MKIKMLKINLLKSDLKQEEHLEPQSSSSSNYFDSEWNSTSSQSRSLSSWKSKKKMKRKIIK